mmetsp:Transcript_55703/g.111694  ORF Transcript_55703/g.111694 Transcript_55703/m.111694 type:complete len:107 (-) Transcript_55703:312-632(-)
MESSRGIQQLMEAEQTATKIVQEMREAKVERMKQAKTEAAVVVDTYKKDKESEFSRRAAATGLSAETASLERQTDAEIAEMNIQFEQNKEASIQMMIGHVTAVKLD